MPDQLPPSSPDEDIPPAAISVSPVDKSSDRAQMDSYAEEATAARELNQNEILAALDHLSIVGSTAAEASDSLAKAAMAARLNESTARRRYRIIVATMLLIVAVGLVVGLIVGIFVLRDLDQGKKGRAVAQTDRSVILDCVTPGGKCYERAQTQTSQTIGTITQVSVLAAACAPDYVSLDIGPRIAAIQKCILDHLKNAPAGPQNPRPSETSATPTTGSPTAPQPQPQPLPSTPAQHSTASTPSQSLTRTLTASPPPPGVGRSSSAPPPLLPSLGPICVQPLGCVTLPPITLPLLGRARAF